MLSKLLKIIVDIAFVMIFAVVIVCMLFLGRVEASQHIAGLDISYIEYLEEPTEEEPTEEWIYLGKFEITFYCSCTVCTGNGLGITVTGLPVEAHKTIAVDTFVIPFYSEIKIDGLDYVYQAQDTGGAIKGSRIDVYVTDHDYALELGRWKNIDVWVLKGEQI